MPRLPVRRHLETIPQMLRDRAENYPDELGYAYVGHDEALTAQLTYSELNRRVQSVVAQLQAEGCRPGERAVLFYPTGPEFLAAFLGCLCAGVVAVPMDLPAKRTVHTVAAILEDCSPMLVLTDRGSIQHLKKVLESVPQANDARWIDTTYDGPSPTPSRLEQVEITPETLAYLQYTSGSTGTPAGVMISHRNVLSNLAYIDHVQQTTSETRSVTWLPHFHDMGLVEGLLQPLYSGHTCYVIPPASFLQRPLLWLKTISTYRATHTGGPNFAYEHCLNQIHDSDLASLDLSSLCLAYNGAEPVRFETLERFALRFQRCGLRTTALSPVYGLAEATLMVTCSPNRIVARTVTLRKDRLEQGQVVMTEANDDSVRQLSESGSVNPHVSVRISHPDTGDEAKPNEIGEIWISGENVTDGYWNRPEKTNAAFVTLRDQGVERAYYRTGDLGFLNDGALYVTGRIKDVIIVRGRNHYPQDIEQTVSLSHPSLAPDAAAAFSIDDGRIERLVVIQEVSRTARKEDLSLVIIAIRQAVAREHDVSCHAVAIIRPTTLSKTSSGKIKRRECRQAYLDGRLEILAYWISTNKTN